MYQQDLTNIRRANQALTRASTPPAPDWEPHDFLAKAPSTTSSIIDPWEPVPVLEELNEVSSQLATVDFWDPADAIETVSPLSADDWSADGYLPEFLPNASENPFEISFKPPSHETRVDRKARWLAQLVDIPRAKQRHLFASRFAEIFAAYPHGSSFSAISELAIDGATPEEIILCFELRQLWSSFPQWWGVRRRGQIPVPAENGEALLSWKKAHRFVFLRKGLPAEEIIDPDWLSDWFDVPAGEPLYWRFIDFAEARIASFALGDLETQTIRKNVRKPSWMEHELKGQHSFSRTANLMRSQSDGWVQTGYTVTRSSSKVAIYTSAKASA